jgi:hypothetical protein
MKEVRVIVGRQVPLVDVDWRVQETIFLERHRPNALDLRLKIFGHM